VLPATYNYYFSVVQFRDQSTTNAQAWPRRVRAAHFRQFNDALSSFKGKLEPEGVTDYSKQFYNVQAGLLERDFSDGVTLSGSDGPYRV
jgi:hypothetical protein